MNLLELQHKLIAAARAARPDDRVPYAFEKRIMARLAGQPALNPWLDWERGLIRAAAFSVVAALALGLGAYFLPAGNQETLSQDVEKTLLAAVDNPSVDVAGNSRRVKAWKLILATLIIFGAGVVTGGLLVNHVVRAKSHPKASSVPVMTPWHARTRDLSRRMEKELKLTPEQRQRIEKIIADSQDRTKALWKPIAAEMTTEMQNVHEQIRQELTPDQRLKYDELVKQRPAKKGEKNEDRPRRAPDNAATNPPAAGAPATNAAPATP